MLELARQNQLHLVVQRSTTERRRVREALALVMPLVCALCTVAQAEIRTDGSLNRPAISLSGPNFLITEAQGRLAGSNLFYSFQVFNVGNAESATFVTTTAGLANVISRVTGGSPSQINGLVSLQSTSAAPNFFFINPAGVVFGRGARIDVPAGFHVSTADYLKFPDGNFYADPKAVSTLSSAAPEAFGFLGTTRAAVSINNSANIGTPNAPFDIVAGDVTVDNATLQNQAGDVRVIAVGGRATEIGLTGTSTFAAGTLTLADGGSLNTTSAGAIPAGNITVAAGTISISGVRSGTYSTTPVGATAGAGNIDVLATQDLSIVNGGVDTSGISGISASTAGTGNAGNVDVTVNGTLSIVNGGAIKTDTNASGNAGTVTVKAGALVIDSSFISSDALGTGKAGIFATGSAGDVNVTVNGTLSIVNGASTTAGTYTSGNAGTVTVKAGTLVIDNAAVGISSFTAGAGNAGNVDVTVDGMLSIVRGGVINTDTFYLGNAGNVTVRAGTLNIDGMNSLGHFTRISSDAFGNGSAGKVNVTVEGTLSVVNSGQISSGTAASGNGGTVKVTAREIFINGGEAAILSDANSLSSGDAGDVEVTASGTLSIVGGRISSATLGSGHGGAIKVTAGDILIDRQGSLAFTGVTSQAGTEFFFGSSGNAGSVEVTSNGRLLILGGGQISSDTFGSGNGGTVKVTAGGMVIDNQGAVLPNEGISSDSVGGTGNAGNVEVTVIGGLSIVNYGRISSGTFGSGGHAGSVRVSAGIISGDTNGSIGAVAGETSSGQTGTVTILASEGITLTNGSSFSIENGATVANPSSLIPTLLTVSAPNISLASASQITAASFGNVAASNVQVNFGPQLTVSNASISTSANGGNGGSIAVRGTGTLFLQNGQITTSVAGAQGNGGDISIEAPILVMQTGFIQANTAATNASGGKVNIDVGALLPSGSTLFVGGTTPLTFAPDVFGFNVIQAAAPTGVSGTIQISTPVLDLIGSISALPAEFLNSGGLGRSPCAIVGGSSLSQVGRGAMPRRAGDLLWIESIIDGPATPPAGASSSDTLVPPYRTAGSTVRSRTNPCWS